MKLQKRLLIIFLISAITTAVSYGQAALIVLILGDRVATENFHLSIDGALNFSSLPGLETGKTFIGANFGLGTHIKLGNKWYLKPEFKPLSQKGAKGINTLVPISGDIETAKTNIRLNYIDVPVLLQYNITPNIFISAGPEISFLTSATQICEGTLNGKDVTVRLDTKYLFNNIDFSFPVELGYTVHVSTKKSTTKVTANIFARYNHGFTEVFKDPATRSSRLSLFQIGANFPFIKSAEELAKAKKN
jgi:hypothetical protein